MILLAGRGCKLARQGNGEDMNDALESSSCGTSTDGIAERTWLAFLTRQLDVGAGMKIPNNGSSFALGKKLMWTEVELKG